MLESQERITFFNLFKKDVLIERDIRYTDSDNNPRHVLDVYSPPASSGLPVVLFFYGGGWRSGDKRLFEHLGRAFAVRGIVAVTVNYRLTPEATHPDHAEDCAAAVAWVHTNIARFGGNPDDLFLTGHSAGAHLAALVTADRHFLEQAGVPYSAIHGVAAISGAMDLAEHVGSTVFTKREFVEEAFGGTQEELKAASPQYYIGAGMPPFLMIVAEDDPEGLRLQGKGFADALREAGIEARYMSVKGRDHFSIVRRFGPSDDATAEAIASFVHALSERAHV